MKTNNELHIEMIFSEGLACRSLKFSLNHNIFIVRSEQFLIKTELTELIEKNDQFSSINSIQLIG